MGLIPFLFLIGLVVGLIWMAMHVQEDTLDTRPNDESWSQSGAQQSSNHPIHSNLDPYQYPYLEPEMFPVEQLIPPQITASRYQPEHLEACKTLFDTVEGAGKVPFGFAKEFNIVLEKETHLKYLLWNAGNIIAFGALIPPWACPPPEDGSPHRLDIFTCCFGIVHPDWQGKRLGRVLLALRAITAHEQEGSILFLTATDFSKSYFEMLGFKFPPDGTHADDNGALHHHGYAMIHETICDRLKLFLSANGIAIPETDWASAMNVSEARLDSARLTQSFPHEPPIPNFLRPCRQCCRPQRCLATIDIPVGDQPIGRHRNIHMKCIKCEEEARAVCKFCGRAVCKEHIQQGRFVSGYTGSAGFWSMGDNAVSVDDAVWCGECHPEYHGTS